LERERGHYFCLLKTVCCAFLYLLCAGYYLSYKITGGEWSEVSLEYDLLSYTLANLTCGSGYSLNLVAHNIAGRSKPSATLTSPTQGAIPGLPDTSALLTGAAVLRTIMYLLRRYSELLFTAAVQ
jgi:hypothetical protein